MIHLTYSCTEGSANSYKQAGISVIAYVLNEVEDIIAQREYMVNCVETS